MASMPNAAVILSSLSKQPGKMTGVAAGLTGACLKPVDHAIRVIKGQRKPAGAETVIFEHGGKIVGKVAYRVGNVFQSSDRFRKTDACMPRAGWRKRRYRFGPIAESLIQTIGDVAAKTICKGSAWDRHKVADPAQADSLKTGDGIVRQPKSGDRKHCKNVLCCPLRTEVQRRRL